MKEQKALKMVLKVIRVSLNLTSGEKIKLISQVFALTFFFTKRM